MPRKSTKPEIVKKSDYPHLNSWWGAEPIEEALSNTGDHSFTPTELLSTLIEGFREARENGNYANAEKLGRSIIAIIDRAGLSSGTVLESKRTLRFNPETGVVQEAIESSQHIIKGLGNEAPESSQFTQIKQPADLDSEDDN